MTRYVLLIIGLLLIGCEPALESTRKLSEVTEPADESIDESLPGEQAAPDHEDGAANDGGDAQNDSGEDSPQDVAAKLAAQTEAKMDELLKKLKAEKTIWNEAYQAAPTRESKEELRSNTPEKAFGKSMLELASIQPGSQVSQKAFREILMRGDQESKRTAMAGMIKFADDNPESELNEAAYLLLTQFGFGEHQTLAMTRLFDKAKDELKSSDNDVVQAAEGMLVQLISNNGSLQIRNPAALLLLDRIDRDVRSNLSANRLETVAISSLGETQLEAVRRLVEHHIDGPCLANFLERGIRQPSHGTEQAIKLILQECSGHLQAKAALALAKYISTRNYYSGLNDQRLKRFGNEVIDYLRMEPESNEMANIESVLDQYISENDKTLSAAKESLYLVKNLTVGKTAPEISGTDLDGQEFKLSDYRGKIVFLDFWGDW